MQDQRSFFSSLSPAFFVSNPSDEEKRRLQLVGAIYSLSEKGWFLSLEQKNRAEQMTSIPESDIVTKGVGIFVDDVVDAWKVHGDTYTRRDAIKKLGARWSPSDKSWKIPKEKASKDEIIAALS